MSTIYAGLVERVQSGSNTDTNDASVPTHYVIRLRPMTPYPAGSMTSSMMSSHTSTLSERNQCEWALAFLQRSAIVGPGCEVYTPFGRGVVIRHCQVS